MKITCMATSIHIIRRSSQTDSRAQYAVLTKVLGVKKVHCVVGFSMGGQQVGPSVSIVNGSLNQFVSVAGLPLGDGVPRLRRQDRSGRFRRQDEYA